MRLIDADALIANCQLAQKQADRHGREYANAFYSGGGDISTEWWCVEDMIENAPTIEIVKEIGYAECANAMLKMWVDNVLTDSEYMRIMNKLNKHWMKEGEKPCD